MSKRQATFIPGKPFWVNVRQEHVENGVECEPYGCPIYLAIRERLPALRFGVLAEFIDLEEELYPYVRKVPLPAVAIEWREAFDAGVKSYPFKFQLTIPAKPERREA